MPNKLHVFNALCLFAVASHAGDMAHYRGHCTVLHGQQVAYDSWCDIAIDPEAGAASAVVFHIKPSGKSDEIRVSSYRNQSPTVNGVPAQEIAGRPGWFRFVTSEHVDVRFSQAPATLEF